MKSSQVFLPSYFMLFCLILSIIYGETRDDDLSMNERKIRLHMSEPIARFTGKRLKNNEGNTELKVTFNQ